MKKFPLSVTIVAIVTGFSALASGASISSRNRVLRGDYILQAAGALNGTEITGLGLLTFLKDGNATGTVTFSLGDSSVQSNHNCTFPLQTASAITVSNGVSSMTLSFCPSGSTCTTFGTLNFNFIVQPGAQEARLMLTGFSSAVPTSSSSPDPNGICGAALDTTFGSLTLAGDLAKQ
jgi:hypothetical protein